ncbi:HET-domain-containing protein, partial [Sporormia fimetaria CBS 119925]
MHIRVLIIQPGAFKDDLQVVLRHAVLDPTRSIPEFDALSYVWGPPEPKERVYLDNKTHYLDIGINLGVALRHLRYKDKTRAIWADAVCINQPDPEELGDQVRQMGTLYRLARRVIAWLGPEEDNSARAMDVLKDL